MLPSLTVLAVVAAVRARRARHRGRRPGERGSPATRWPGRLLAAVFGTVGLFAFYRGMAAGAISVVTPIARVAAGIPVIWGVAVSGDQSASSRRSASSPRSAAVSRASLELRPERRQIAAGVGWAVLAMLAFGAYYVPMHAASTQDWLWPAFLFRCTSVTLVWSVVLVARARPTGFADTGRRSSRSASSTPAGTRSTRPPRRTACSASSRCSRRSIRS